MEIDTKIPSKRGISDQNSAVIMECGEVEREQVEFKKPGFFLPIHSLDWNKGHF